MRTIALTINGKQVAVAVEPRTHLADLLRETLNLTGTHIGCEHGVCGACTVMIDGAVARSCITYAIACEGAQITTIEGLDEDEIVTELRDAFAGEHALQCGYCTPGMLISARDLVLRLGAPAQSDIREAMSGNLCRCTGYVGIIRAIDQVIADRRARGIAAMRGGGRTNLGPVGSRYADGTAEAARIGSVMNCSARTAPSPSCASSPAGGPETAADSHATPLGCEPAGARVGSTRPAR